MPPSGHPPLQLANRPTLDPNGMWIRSGNEYAYAVEWSLLEMHLSPWKEWSLLTIRWGSNGRRRRVGEDAKSPLDVRPHLLLFVLLLRHPAWSLCASSERWCHRHLCDAPGFWSTSLTLKTGSAESNRPNTGQPGSSPRKPHRQTLLDPLTKSTHTRGKPLVKDTVKPRLRIDVSECRPELLPRSPNFT
jgi:hypothetical protein